MPTPSASISEHLHKLKCCVLVPTYNNAGTLSNVLDRIMLQTKDLIVINDGCTDNSSDILKHYPHVQQLHLSKNTGKGHALHLGFNKALDLGFDFAITIDSDGQHFPEDIPVFINALDKSISKNLLLIGARNMQQSDVPGKSSFGNKFSNFWFWFETGIWLTDTQCGFRLYPLREIDKLQLYTPKFEFEIEVIVKASWHGTSVQNVPVKVAYESIERVSHFRTVPDFARISILNTWLVFISVFYIKPRNLIRKIKKKGLKKFLLEDLLKNNDSPKKKALSIAFGVFIGLSPFWGFQTILVLFLSALLKLNRTIAFAASNISIPPVIPFAIYFSLELGMWITGQKITFSIEELTHGFGFLGDLKVYIIGSLALAILTSIVIGLIGFLILSYSGKKKIVINNG